jgi:predicted aspartyl protease
MADVIYDLIKGVPFVTARIVGRKRSFTGRFVVDTGAAMTIVRTPRIDALGYNAKDATKLFSTESVIGKEEGYRLIIPKIEVFGHSLDDIEVAAVDLPPRYNIDGLIGMNVLSRFEFTFFPQNNLIRAKLL